MVLGSGEIMQYDLLDLITQYSLIGLPAVLLVGCSLIARFCIGGR